MRKFGCGGGDEGWAGFLVLIGGSISAIVDKVEFISNSSDKCPTLSNSLLTLQGNSSTKPLVNSYKEEEKTNSFNLYLLLSPRNNEQ